MSGSLSPIPDVPAGLSPAGSALLARLRAEPSPEPHRLRQLLADLREQVATASPHLAALGAWPAHIDPLCLLERMPGLDGTSGVGGFDAGLAAALGLIPVPAQAVAAALHAAYTPAVLDRVRDELSTNDPDLASFWWLAACSVCDESPSDPQSFWAQCVAFAQLMLDPPARLAAARATLTDMLTSFTVEELGTHPVFGVLGDLAVSVRDGGMQGAYLAGFELAAGYVAERDLFFLGTPQPSLGLEGFEFLLPGDDPSLVESNAPVHGSRQFVKFSSRERLLRALPHVDPALRTPPGRG